MLQPLVLCVLLAQPTSSDHVTIKGLRGQSLEVISRLVSPLGRIEGRGGNGSVRVSLRRGVTSRAAYLRLRGVAGIQVDYSPVARTFEHGERESAEGWEPSWKDAADWMAATRRDAQGNLDWASLYREAKYARTMPPSELRSPGSHLPIGTWEYIGPRQVDVPYRQYFGHGVVSGRVSGLAAANSGGSLVLYAATPYGGIRKSTDGGVTWSFKSYGAAWTQLHTSCVAVDPSDSNTIYVGTGDYKGTFGGGGLGLGYGMGVMRSSDGGDTWDAAFNADSVAAMGTNIAISKIIVLPAAGSFKKTIVATTGRGQRRGVGQVFFYRIGSGSGDQTWTAAKVAGGANGSIPNADWSGLAASLPHPSTGVRLAYAAHATFPNQMVYRSADNGQSWTAMTAPASPNLTLASFDVACSTVNRDTVFCLAADRPQGNVYRSDNQGSSWTAVGNNIPQGWQTTGLPINGPYNWSQADYDWHLTVAGWNDNGTPRDALYVGLIDLVCSRYANDNWTSIGQSYFANNQAFIHNDQHCAVVNPLDPSQVFAGNDGGVYLINHNRSANTWTYTSLNMQLDNTQFYSFGSHVRDFGEFRVYGGTQDNGTPMNRVTASDFGDWISVPSGGDGGQVAQDRVDTPYRYASVNNLGVWRSTDSGNSWTDITFKTGVSPNIVTWKGQPTAFIAPIAVNEGVARTLFVGTDRIWVYNGTSWSERARKADLATGEVITAIKAPGITNRIYFGTSLGKFFYSNDNGNTATQMSLNLPAVAITSITCDPNDQNFVVLSQGALNGRNLWRTSTIAPGVGWTDVGGPTSGDTNLRLPQAPVSQVILDPDDPKNTWYVAGDLGVFMTVNGSATFTNLGTAHGLPAIQVNGLAFNPQTRHLHVGTFGYGAWRIGLPQTTGSVTFAPGSVLGGNLSIGTVTVSSAAPYGGHLLLLISSNPYVTLPLSVTIPEGATTANFLVGTSDPPSDQVATIEASLGNRVFSGNLEIKENKLGKLILDRTEAFGGSEHSIGTLSLKAGDVAGTGGIDVDVVSSHPSHAWVSPQARIEPGYNSTLISVNTVVSSTFQMVTISCTFEGQTVSDTLYVKPNRPKTFTLDRNEALGGTQHVTGTISIDSPAPIGGQVVTMTNSHPAAVTVPSTIAVYPGYDTQTCFMSTKVVSQNTTVTVTASCNGGTLTQSFLVRANRPVSFVIDPTVAIGGTANAIGTVTLEGPAPPEGQIVNIVPTTYTPISVATSVLVPPGYDIASFEITTKKVTVDKFVNITVSCNGGSKAAGLLVLANQPNSLTVDPPTVLGGAANATGTVSLIGAAAASGQAVNLTSSNPAAASVPGSMTVAPGYDVGSFEVTTSPVAADVTVTITASCNGAAKTDTLLVLSHKVLILDVIEASLLGGSATGTGSVSISGAAPPAGIAVSLSSSNPAAASVPPSASIAPGYDSTTFLVGTGTVSSDLTVTITVSLNGTTRSDTVIVQANGVTGLTLDMASAVGGYEHPTGTVTIRGAAKPAGQPIGLVSSNSNRAFVADPVNVPAGYDSTTFIVTTKPVLTAGNVTLTASANGMSKATTLRVIPPRLIDFVLSPSSTFGGATIQATMTISHPAPAGLSATITKTSGNVNSPPAVGFTTGETTKTFNIPTAAVSAWESSLVRATIGDITLAKTLILTPGGVASVSANPTTVIGGDPSTGTVTITGTAPTGGAVISLSSTTGASVPPTVTIGAGLSSKTFTITTAVTSTQRAVTITASRGGTSKTCTLTVQPGGLLSLSLAPTSVKGGTTSTGTVTLSGAAPAGGRVVALKAGNGYASVPASVTVPAGLTSATFTVSTVVVTTTRTCTITATLNGSVKPATLTITP